MTRAAVAPWERAAQRLGCRARRELPLGPLTTYRVGGNARVGVEANSLEDLAALADAVQVSGAPVAVVGKGSNLLVSDAGFDGIAVVLGDAFAQVAMEGDVVRAGAAATLPVVARRSAGAGLTGFEWAVGVPGSVGGAVRMNAGGHGSDMAASLIAVSVVDLAAPKGQPVIVPAADLDLGYRHSALTASQVVIEAQLQLHAGDVAQSEALIGEIVRWRRANQPGGQNAGSVFTNPPGDSAGRLIDAAGCKGLRIGTAEVATKHANFIQADVDGSADDVWWLMAEVRRRVLEGGGPRLGIETHLLGFAAELGTAGSPGMTGEAGDAGPEGD